LDRAACPAVSVRSMSRATAPTVSPSSRTRRTTPALKSSQSRAVRPDDDPTRECAAAASPPEGRTRAVSEERSAAQGQHARVPGRARDAQGRAPNRSQAAARGTAPLATHVLLAPLDARRARASDAETRRPSRPRHDAAVHAFESARDRSRDSIAGIAAFRLRPYGATARQVPRCALRRDRSRAARYAATGSRACAATARQVPRLRGYGAAVFAVLLSSLACRAEALGRMGAARWSAFAPAGLWRDSLRLHS
jgi:hypothetical protein